MEIAIDCKQMYIAHALLWKEKQDDSYDGDDETIIANETDDDDDDDRGV